MITAIDKADSLPEGLTVWTGWGQWESPGSLPTSS